MPSLADLPEIVGFFSYSRDDDESYKGRLSALREGIQHELSAQLGRSRANFRLWQDKEAIAPGKLWESEIKTAVEQSVFFIPIVTPRALNSDYCKFEFEVFLERERALGRADLVFPILYVPVPALQSEERWRNHAVLSAIAKRQYVDWQTFRYSDADGPIIREAIARFCHQIVDALHQFWLSPEERRRLEEVEAQQRADAQQRRQEAESKRRADEEARRQQEAAEAERRRQEAEARRWHEEAASRARAEREAAHWGNLSRPFTILALEGFLNEFPDGISAASAQLELQALRKVQRAFEAAKLADTLGAADRFLSEYPASEFEQAARDLRATLAKRDEAYRQAMAGNDEAVLQAFIDRYPKGEGVDGVLARLDGIARDKAYDVAMTSENPAVLKAFLAKHSDDARAVEVRARLHKIAPRKLSRRVLLIGGSVAGGGLAITVAALRRETLAPVARSPAPPEAKPSTRTEPFIRSFAGHEGELNGAYFNANSSLIITSTYSSQGKGSRLWDANSGAAIATFADAYAQFSPDGSRIVSEAAEDIPRLCEARTGRELAALRDAWRPKPTNLSGFPYTSARFCPDGSRLATAAEWESTAKLWDGKTGAAIATLAAPTNEVFFHFSPESTRIATTSNDSYTVHLWDLRTGASIDTVALSSPAAGELTHLIHVDFSPDGKRLAIGASWENVVRLHDGKTGAAIGALRHSETGAFGSKVQFSADSGRVLTSAEFAEYSFPALGPVAGIDQPIVLWDAITGASLTTIETIKLPKPSIIAGIPDPVRIIAEFSPDGNLIITAHGDDKLARVWNARTGQSLYTLIHAGPVGQAVFSPDSSRIVTWEASAIRLWDATNGAALTTISDWRSTSFGSFSPNSGRFVTYSGSTARIWNARTGKAASTLSGHTADINSAQFSPDSRFVLTTSGDKTARLWDATLITETPWR